MALIKQGLKYFPCKKCDGYGYVTMTGKIPNTMFPNQEYDFGFSCTCINGNAVKAAAQLADFVKAAQFGFKVKHD